MSNLDMLKGEATSEQGAVLPHDDMIPPDFGEKLLNRIAQIFQPAARMEILNRKEFLTEKEVEELFSIPVATLQTNRCRNKGARYIKEGRKVLYPKKELMEYYLSGLVKIKK